MKCPYCGKDDDKVIESRPSQEEIVILRRRQCLACAGSFSTYESTEDQLIPFLIRKKIRHGATIINVKKTMKALLSKAFKAITEQTEALMHKTDHLEEGEAEKETEKKAKPKATTKKKAPGKKHTTRKTTTLTTTATPESPKHEVIEKRKTAETTSIKEGKYLTFALDNQKLGINILKIKEIIGMMPIRTMPQSPPFVKGVINLRGEVIPVIDLRLRLGMQETDYSNKNCIIVLEFESNGKPIHQGLTADSVSEVLDIKISEMEEVPFFGTKIDTSYIQAIAKMKGEMQILLDIDQLLS